MFFKKKSVKRIKVVQPREAAQNNFKPPVNRFDHQRAVEEEAAPLMGRSSTATSNPHDTSYIVGGMPAGTMSDGGTTNVGSNNTRRRRSVTNNNAWCGGYPYNLIVVAFAVIVFAIAGYFVYQDWADNNTYSPTTSPTAYGETHAPTLVDHDKTKAPTAAPTPTGYGDTHVPTLVDEDKTNAPTAKPTPSADQHVARGGVNPPMPTASTDSHVARGGVNPPSPYSVSETDDVTVETTPSGPVNSPAASPAVGSKQRLRR